MAINPATEYPVQIDSTDPTGYPYGKAQNDSTPGDGTGTPLEREWVSDLFGFQQAVLAESGQVPSGNPDKVGASQYSDGLQRMIRREASMSLWTALTPPGSYSGTYRSCAFSPETGVLAAVGTLGALHTYQHSGAGTGTSSGDTGDDFFAVAWCPSISLLVAVGNLGNIFTGPGNAPWTQRTQAGAFSGTFRAVADNGSEVMVVGSDGETQTSPDGINWSSVATFHPGAVITGLCWAGDRWIAVGTGAAGGVFSSADGATWTAASSLDFTPTLTGNLVSVAWSPDTDTLVAVGDGGRIYVSTDKGANWTQSTAPSGYSGNYSAVTYAPHFGMFVAVGASQGGWSAQRLAVETSPDGVTWRRRYPRFPGNTYNGVCATAIGEVVTVGSLGRVLASNPA